VVGVSASAIIPLLEATPGLLRYQIRYEQPDVLELTLLNEGPVDEEMVMKRVLDALRQQGAIPPRVVVRPGNIPGPWAAPVGSKEHHVKLAVTQEQMLAIASDRRD
jgi:hypothetical protein